MQCTDERKVGDVTVLEVGLQGLGDIGTGVTNHVRALLAQGRTRLVLNFSAIKSLDSHGLGDLVASQQAGIRGGARVALCCVHPYVAEPLSIMNVDDLFDVFESEQEAIQSFG
jgi:anti-anti-sigma factor